LKCISLAPPQLIHQLAESKTYKEAGLRAGLAAKNISTTVHGMIQRIQRKMPDVLESLGLTGEWAVKNRLLPLMHAKEVKFIQNGKAYVELENTSAQLRALHMFFLLGGHYAPKEQITQEMARIRAINMVLPRAALPPPNGDAKNGGGK
jgi:hypothetical protein